MAITFSDPKRLPGTKKYYSRTYDRETGRRTWVSTGFDTMKEAKEWVATQRMQEALGPTRVSLQAAEAKTLGEAVEEWLDEKQEKVSADRYQVYAGQSSYWLCYLRGATKLRDVTPDDLRQYLRKRKLGSIHPSAKSRSKPLTATTINEDLRGLSTFFRYCLRRDWLLKSPTLGIERFKGEARRRIRSLTSEQEDALLQACKASETKTVKAKRNTGGPKGGKTTREKRTFQQTVTAPSYLFPIVLIALRSGLRRKTILSLRWEHVDFERCTWNIPGDIVKTRSPYQAPMAASIGSALKEYRSRLLEKLGPSRVASKALIFQLRRPKPKRDSDGPAAIDLHPSKPSSQISNFKRAFQRAARRAGLLGLTFHDCRRIFLNRLRERGVPIDVAIKLSAHTSLQTVMQHYREIPEQVTRDAVRVLDEASPATLPAPTETTRQADSTSSESGPEGA